MSVNTKIKIVFAAFFIVIFAPCAALAVWILAVTSIHWLLKLAVIGFIIFFIIGMVVLAALALKGEL